MSYTALGSASDIPSSFNPLLNWLISSSFSSLFSLELSISSTSTSVFSSFLLNRFLNFLANNFSFTFSILSFCSNSSLLGFISVISSLVVSSFASSTYSCFPLDNFVISSSFSFTTFYTVHLHQQALD